MLERCLYDGRLLPVVTAHPSAMSNEDWEVDSLKLLSLPSKRMQRGDRLALELHVEVEGFEGVES